MDGKLFAHVATSKLYYLEAILFCSIATSIKVLASSDVIVPVWQILTC